MIRKLLACAIVAICVGVIASPALAVWTPPITRGTIYAPNPSFGSRITVLAQWIVGGFGHNITSTIEYTRENGCLHVWRQYWRGPEAVGAPVLIKDFCQP